MIIDVKGYEGLYQIDEDGNVYSYKIGKAMKSHKDTKRGYQRVTLTSTTGQRSVLYNHRLVALNFLEQVDGKDQVNHIDGNNQNNSLSNLEWVSCKENIVHSFETGIRPKENMGKRLGKVYVLSVDDQSELLEMYSSIKVSQRELARMFNVSRGAIANVINNYEREVA